MVVLSGHKSAVSAMAFDVQGMQLASGGNDTNIIVWDIVAETGLYRLKGHKDVITGLHFLRNANVLLSSSKDKYIRVWDLDIQHCAQTVVGHRNEICSFALDGEESRLISGTANEEMYVWTILYDADPVAFDSAAAGDETTHNDDALDDANVIATTAATKVRIALVGKLMRSGKERVVSMRVHNPTQTIAVQSADKLIEFYRLHSPKEVTKKLKRRQKRLREKAAEKGTSEVETAVTDAADHMVHLYNLRLSAKSVSCAWGRTVKKGADKDLDAGDTQVDMVVALHNNTIESHAIKLSAKTATSSPVSQLQQPGHRSGVRCVAISDDSKMLVSCSSNEIKVWNMATRTVIRTLPSGYCLCVTFIPGNRHVVVGYKTGEIELFDIASATSLQKEMATEGGESVWSIAMRPDKRRFVTGAADKNVKFWDLDLIADEEYSTTSKRLGFVHSATLKMSDDVLCVKYTPDQRLIAVSLLDSTVKLFFEDTLKFFTSLYGHKLPVLSMDISADSTLMITASADKNIKLWGLDFGDCHRSMFAHADSIMGVSFVANTHYAFSVSKDRTIKYWDCDTFEHILTLNGHHGEVWCTAVSHHGRFMVSGSHDRSLRVWTRTDEQVLLEEEREREREEAMDSEMVTENTAEAGAGEAEGDVTMVGADGLGGKKTVETIKGAEQIIDAIELAENERENMAEHKKAVALAKINGVDAPPPFEQNIIMKYLRMDSPERYVLHIVKKIKPNDLQEALLLLPFNHSTNLLRYIEAWIKKSWSVELCCRCLFFLLRVHQKQIVSNQVMVDTLDSLRMNTRGRISELKNIIGFNVAALNHIKRKMEDESTSSFFGEQSEQLNKNMKKKQRLVRPTF
ncbi:hypothetical protein SARC_10890 [Sphaeroforma arctica JP610]|uniref:Small-subunit processome Utp12 domain-containing protein n=1 Tax=Sphaeroforma arctica JP610 TaxID=667725 RepID=A0A0L0FIP8_9EUKA|nr:hypothetical protein SARC_10890 [Sphaeroforma arctica JP610]KNC76620.1 hypothetical protein SARC_10890 [Sphaeroforma arctica JP610]|eukprot:XP_014150522.1 hypothetical protein SARC_10890 [Sphaeroforma arctica JP610]